MKQPNPLYFVLMTWIIALWMIAGHAFIYGLPHWMYVDWNKPSETITTTTTTTDNDTWCVAIVCSLND